jgi:AcrR family transcriptional regulator
MQVSTCMKSPTDSPPRAGSTSVDQTRQRLIDAAGLVLCRRGIQGATTREIAQAAEVNEVTLFRHFKSKEHLISAVIDKGIASEIELMDQHSSWKQDLRRSVLDYARHYYNHLEQKEAFARALIAEARTLPQSTQKVICDVVLPVRKRLVSILEDAQRAGVVRSELNAEQALDVLRNALYAGMLRNTAGYLPRSYSTQEYIDTVVDIFVRGVEAKPGPSRSEGTKRETSALNPDSGLSDDASNEASAKLEALAKSQTRNAEP